MWEENLATSSKVQFFILEKIYLYRNKEIGQNVALIQTLSLVNRMEKTLEKGEEKIQKICDALRREALEPSKEEAQSIIEDAKTRAKEIIKEAHEQADKVIENAKEAIERERNVFHSSLEQAGKQALEELRQSIEHKLFNDELQQILEGSTTDPKVVSKLIASLVQAIDKEGISTELSAIIPHTVSTKEVNNLIGTEILEKLKEKSVTIGEFGGGAQVKLHDKKMTIDITVDALMELLSNYVRKDFRKLLFKE